MKPSEKLPLLAIGFLLILYVLAYSVWIIMQMPDMKAKIEDSELYLGILTALTAGIALVVPLIASKSIRNTLSLQNQLTIDWDTASTSIDVKRQALLNRLTYPQEGGTERKPPLMLIHGETACMESLVGTLLRYAAHDGYMAIRTTFKDIQAAGGQFEKIWRQRAQVPSKNPGLPRTYQLYFAIIVSKSEWEILKNKKAWISAFLTEWPKSKILIAISTRSENLQVTQEVSSVNYGIKRLTGLVHASVQHMQITQTDKKIKLVPLDNLPAVLFGLRIYPAAVVRPVAKLGWAILWTAILLAIIQVVLGNVAGVNAAQAAITNYAQAFIYIVAFFSALYALTSEVAHFTRPLLNKLFDIVCSLIAGYFLANLLPGHWTISAAVVYIATSVVRLAPTWKEGRSLNRLSFRMCVLVGAWIALCPPRLDTSDWAIWSTVIAAWWLLNSSTLPMRSRLWVTAFTLGIVIIVLAAYATNPFWEAVSRAAQSEVYAPSDIADFGIWQWEFIAFSASSFVMLFIILGLQAQVNSVEPSDVSKCNAFKHVSLLLLLANAAYIIRISQEKVAGLLKTVYEGAWNPLDIDAMTMIIRIFPFIICMLGLYVNSRYRDGDGGDRRVAVYVSVGFVSTYISIAGISSNNNVGTSVLPVYALQGLAVIGIAVAVNFGERCPEASMWSTAVQFMRVLAHGFVISIMAVSLITITYWPSIYGAANRLCITTGFPCNEGRLEFSARNIFSTFSESDYYLPVRLLGAIFTLACLVFIGRAYGKLGSAARRTVVRVIRFVMSSQPAFVALLLFLTLLFIRRFQEGNFRIGSAWVDFLSLFGSVLAAGVLLVVIYLRCSSSFHPVAIGAVAISFLWAESPQDTALALGLAVAGGPSVKIYRGFHRPTIGSFCVASFLLVLFYLAHLSPMLREHELLLGAEEAVSLFDPLTGLILVVLFVLLLVVQPNSGGRNVWSDSRRQIGMYRWACFWVLIYCVLLLTATFMALIGTSGWSSLSDDFFSQSSTEYLALYVSLLAWASLIYFLLLLWGAGGWHLLEASSELLDGTSSKDHVFCQSIRSLATTNQIGLSDWDVILAERR